MLQHLNVIASKPRRVLLLGAGGFVGSATAKNLRHKGIETVSLTRNEVDLLKPDATHVLEELIQPEDALVILAAIAPCKTTQELVENLQMLQTACTVISRKADQLAQIIYISSDAVYADDVSLVTEDSLVQPNSLHGMMHAAREMMLKSTAGNIPLAILRPSLLYGVNDPHNGYGPNRFIRLVQQHQKITLFGGGEEQRDHIYVEDIAEIIAQTLLHRSKGILNVVTGKSIAFKTIAEKIIQLFDADVNIEATERKNAITHRHFDITACRKAFPLFNYTDIEMGLTQVLQQAKELVT